MAIAARKKTARSAAARPSLSAGGGKAIVILSDGTGNSAAALFKTNIWRIYKALDLSEKPARKQRRQIAYYDDGVGTSSFRPLALLGGAFGVGLKRNVLDLYRFICHNYEDGDEIYAFGFSRGAFTIRVTVGLLDQAGVLKFEKEDDLLRYSADAYRDLRRQFTQGGWFPNPAAAASDKPKDEAPAPGLLVIAFRSLRDWVIRRERRSQGLPLYEELDKQPGPQHRKRIDRIRFVGVFDTVAAYGMPIAELTRAIDDWIWPLSMPDYKLSPKVEAARHALSLDDERDTFHPLVWDENEEERLVAEKLIKRGRMKQVWFGGMHSDVGGGYPDDAAALVPLQWMIGEAKTAGLRFNTAALQLLKKEANAFAPLHDSRRGIGSYYRLQPRKLSARLNLDPPDETSLIMQDPRLDGQGMLTSVAIHESVLERVRDGTDRTAPIVLPARYKLVRNGRAVRAAFETPESADLRARGQEWVWNLVWVRRLLYFATVAVSAVVTALPFFPPTPTSDCNGPQCLVAHVISAASNFVPSFMGKWLEFYEARPGLLISFGGILLALLAVSSAVERRMRDQMRMLWDLSLNPGSEAPSRRYPHLSTDPTLSLVYRLRTNGTYQRALRRLKWRLIPLVFGICALALFLNLAMAVPIRLAVVAGLLPPELCSAGDNSVLWLSAACWLEVLTTRAWL